MLAGVTSVRAHCASTPAGPGCPADTLARWPGVTMPPRRLWRTSSALHRRRHQHTFPSGLSRERTVVRAGLQLSRHAYDCVNVGRKLCLGPLFKPKYCSCIPDISSNLRIQCHMARCQSGPKPGASPAKLCMQAAVAATAMLDDGTAQRACPPCSVPVSVPCLGGHEQMRMPCCEAGPRPCAGPCGRRLPCGSHFPSGVHACSKACHSVSTPGALKPAVTFSDTDLKRGNSDGPVCCRHDGLPFAELLFKGQICRIACVIFVSTCGCIAALITPRVGAYRA